MISQYFIGGMMPDSASPVQQGLTVIEIRPTEAVGSVLKRRACSRAGLIAIKFI